MDPLELEPHHQKPYNVIPRTLLFQVTIFNAKNSHTISFEKLLLFDNNH